MSYATILADPPWPERGGGKIRRGANRHYPLMTVKAIAALPVATLAQPDAHLYLWVTNNYLPAGLEVMAAWGFRYVTTITWCKVDDECRPQTGLGQYFRGASEQCLFGIRGQPAYKIDAASQKRAQGKTVILAPRTKHSEKPEELRRVIERVSYGPYLELFARQPHEGWTVWGNEVASDLALPSLQPELIP